MAMIRVGNGAQTPGKFLELNAVAQIFYRTPTNWDLVSEDTRFGIYVVQSDKDENFYRVGSVGINSEKTRLVQRLKLHSSRAGEGNWTVENRPWNLVWAAEIQCSDDIRYGVLGLEYALFAEFAKHFKAVKTSGFHAANRHEEVMRVIDQFKPTLDAIAEMQF